MDGTEREARISAAWESFDELSEADFLALIEKLAAELPPDSGIGFFERASSLDSTGHPYMAVPLTHTDVPAAPDRTRPALLGARRCPLWQGAKRAGRRPAYVAMMRA